jgi:hypothetical protein
MKQPLSILATASLSLCLFAGVAMRLSAQSHSAPAPHKILLRADLQPGEVLRYELEAGASFLPITDASGANLFPPRGPCDYSLAAIVTLRPQPPDKDGNTPVEAGFRRRFSEAGSRAAVLFGHVPRRSAWRDRTDAYSGRIF